jgi:Zn-dependent protease
MGERDWQSSEYDRQDRLAGIKQTLARIFGDGENPLAWGFKFGSLGTTPIKVHLLFVIYLLVEVIFTLPGNRDGVVFVLPRLGAIVFFVLLREIVHASVAKRSGGNAIEIMLWPMGGLVPPEVPEHWFERLKIALSPLILNLVLLPVFALPLVLITRDIQSLLINPLTLRGTDTVIAFPDGSTAWWLVALGAIHAANLTLLVINLIPMYPLDGARVLESVLSKNNPDHRAQWLSVHTGLIAATAIGILALVMQDGTPLFVLCVVCGLICSGHRRRLQFLATADMIPGLSGGSFRASENHDASDAVDERVDQEEIDRILAKISEQGIGALSRKERRTLKRATETSRQSQ